MAFSVRIIQLKIAFDKTQDACVLKVGPLQNENIRRLIEGHLLTSVSGRLNGDEQNHNSRQEFSFLYLNWMYHEIV